jgi:hypothetical protein
MTDQLFDMDPAAPVVTAPVEKLSADRRRTIRQRNDLARGVHPLSAAIGRPDWRPLRLHEDENRTCGNCRFRELLGHHSRSYPKCMAGDGVRATHGAATDVRAWWRGCTGHEYDPETPGSAPGRAGATTTQCQPGSRGSSTVTVAPASSSNGQG